MIIQFKRTLSKELVQLKNSLPEKQSYSRQEIANLFSELQSNLEGSFATMTQNIDKTTSEAKNSLKKANKAYIDLKVTYAKKELEMTKENEEMRKELERSKKKVHELLKCAQKNSLSQRKKEEKVVFEKGIQCNIKDQKMEQIMEGKQKQNISLKQRIPELQKEVEDRKQDIEGANVLIKELVRQLETNIADRETWNGSGSSNASELDSFERLDEQDESSESDSGVLSEMEEELSLRSACRGGENLGEDCSTIDGSNTTNKDYALPQWVEFGEPTSKTQLYQAEEEEEKMWPELLWDRFRKLSGCSFEL